MPRRKNDSPFPGSNTLLVLAMLEDADKYGYQIIRELECRSDQTFSMNEGTLYPILHSLEERGEVRSYERESTAGRLRRYYQLTRQGVKTLARCRREWEKFCKSFGKVVGGEACVTKGAHQPVSGPRMRPSSLAAVPRTGAARADRPSTDAHGISAKRPRLQRSGGGRAGGAHARRSGRARA